MYRSWPSVVEGAIFVVFVFYTGTCVIGIPVRLDDVDFSHILGRLEPVWLLFRLLLRSTTQEQCRQVRAKISRLPATKATHQDLCSLSLLPFIKPTRLCCEILFGSQSQHSQHNKRSQQPNNDNNQLHLSRECFAWQPY